MVDISDSKSLLSQFKIEVENMDQTLDIGIDESYEIIISDISNKEYFAKINANNCFGVLRAFETFSQLIETNLLDNGEVSYQISNVPLTIRDSPRFTWRFVKESF